MHVAGHKRVTHEEGEQIDISVYDDWVYRLVLVKNVKFINLKYSFHSILRCRM